MTKQNNKDKGKEIIKNKFKRECKYYKKKKMKYKKKILQFSNKKNISENFKLITN